MKVLVVLVAACFSSSYANYGGGYQGPLASPVVTPNGFLADTPEVAAAKAAHFSEFSKAGSPAGYAPGPYNGAPAAPQYNAAPAYNSAPYQHAGNQYGGSVAPQDYLADTPDVAAAKAAHFAEVAKVNSNPHNGPEDDGSYRPEYDNPSYNSYSAPAAPSYNSYSAPAAPAYNSYSAPAAPAYNSYSASAAPAYNSYSAPQSYNAPSHQGSHYNGPLAKPVVTPQGFLAETPEVAAAKAAHFAEFAKAGTHGSQHGRYRRRAVLVQTPASTVPLAVAPLTHVAYASPYAYYPHSGLAYSVRTW